MPASIALLGSGLFASMAYLPAILAAKDDFHFHTVWSRSQKSAEGLLARAKELGISPLPAVQYGDAGLEAVLKDTSIDGVMLVLPITAQPPLVLKCLAAGKHVMSEKPLHKDVASAIELVEAYETQYKSKGLIFRTAENWAHEPVLHFARDALRDPAIGPVLYWHMQCHSYVEGGNGWHATEWRTIPDYQGGFILDGGVHQAALLRTVLPVPPSNIVSHVALHRAHLPPHDTFVAIATPDPSTHQAPIGPEATSQSGKVLPHKVEDIPAEIGRSVSFGTINLAWSVPDVPRDEVVQNKIEITCLNGVVLITWPRGQMNCSVIPAKGSSVEASKKEGRQVGVETEVAMFARAVAARKAGKEETEENWAEPRGSLWDLALIQACLQSNGKTISIDQLVKGK